MHLLFLLTQHKIISPRRKPLGVKVERNEVYYYYYYKVKSQQGWIKTLRVEQRKIISPRKKALGANVEWNKVCVYYFIKLKVKKVESKHCVINNCSVIHFGQSVTKINLKLQGRRCYENEFDNSSFGQRSYFLNYKIHNKRALSWLILWAGTKVGPQSTRIVSDHEKIT